ncbi:MAG: D-alanyl-D-alanine carboxypeptidase family protein [Clostridiales bacterium]|nr:D-alanyl-D-alanine carboxypeptidase family protein [Clostridiales bacterium]
MRFQPEKRMLRAGMGACAVFALSALTLIFLFLSHQTAEPALALGGRGEWTVLEGAPEPQGTQTYLSRAALLEGKLMQVSPQSPLPKDFSPPNTRDIRAMVGSYLPAEEGVMLCQEAVYALCTIQFEYPLEHGISLIRGTLSNAQQEEWRREAFDRYARVYPLNEALSRVTEEIPGGGESEHQTGYALDLSMKGPLSLVGADPLLHNTTGRWLNENLWRFGWIYRFSPQEESNGSCEGIHLRYVGKVHAAAMHALGIGMEEYLALLREEKALTLLKSQAPYAYLYAIPCESSLSFPIPDGADYEASSDNMGYAIVSIAAQDHF